MSMLRNTWQIVVVCICGGRCPEEMRSTICGIYMSWVFVVVSRYL